MIQYIDKDALMKRIEDWRYKIKMGIFSIPLSGSDKTYATFEYEMLGKIKDFLNTFETKEVELEKEYKDFVEEDPVYNKLVNGIVGKAIAKHFYELGIKSIKGRNNYCNN